MSDRPERETIARLDVADRLRDAFMRVQRHKRGELVANPAEPIWAVINMVPDVLAVLDRHDEFERDLAAEAQEYALSRSAPEPRGGEWRPPKGWVLVPIDPTPEMLRSGFHCESLGEAWAHMLGAARPTSRALPPQTGGTSALSPQPSNSGTGEGA